MFLGRLPIKEHLKTSCKEQATFVTIFFQEFILLFFTSEIELIAFLISESIPKISTVFVLNSMIISIQLFFQSAVVLITLQLADWLSIKLLHYRTKRNKLFRRSHFITYFIQTIHIQSYLKLGNLLQTYEKKSRLTAYVVTKHAIMSPKYTNYILFLQKMHCIFAFQTL